MSNGTLNKIMLIGNLGDDVKMHYFDDKNCVGRFPIATSETYTNRNNEKITSTEWHNIVVRNKGAEICEKYLKKGDKIYIEGKIKTRQWQDENDNTRYSTEIIALDFTFLTPKGDASQASGLSQKPIAEQRKQIDKPSQPKMSSDDDKDDLPF